MSYENIWEKRGVYRKYSSGINGEELIHAMEDVHGHALFDSIFYVINDFLHVTEFDIKTADVITLAAIDKAAALTNPHIKIAIVATLPIIQTLAKLYGDLISQSPYTSEIFTNIDEARVWVS